MCLAICRLYWRAANGLLVSADESKYFRPLCVALACCAESEPAENGTASKELRANSVSATATVLSEEDMVWVCRGGISFRNGTASARLKVGDVSDGIVRLS